jgi:hypothetical protein
MESNKKGILEQFGKKEYGVGEVDLHIKENRIILAEKEKRWCLSPWFLPQFSIK